MKALVKRTDSEGVITYFTIIGLDHNACFKQEDELNDHAYECKTGNTFMIIAWGQNNKWISIFDGKELEL
jgi:hypothetical protein